MAGSDEVTLADTSGCVWPVDTTCLPALPAVDDPDYDSAVLALDAAQALASQVLWALSGRQYGVWRELVRPCPEPYPTGYQRLPYLGGYDVYRWSEYDGWMAWGCGCLGTCIRTGPGAVHLPGPVREITEVTIDGAVIGDTEYVLEGDTLYRTGASWWPRQDLSKPSTEEGTWTVEYLRGITPPDGTGKLVALLATEFYNACTGGKCRLPRTVSEVSRQGVSHRMVNPNDIYASGKTGIPEIDLWLSAVNPHHLAEAPEIL